MSNMRMKHKLIMSMMAGAIMIPGSVVRTQAAETDDSEKSLVPVTGIENILGLKIENGFVRIKPCIPSSWKEYNIKYKWKNAFYNIVVKNPNGKNTGVEKVTVNGIELGETKEIKLEDNGVFNVEVLM